MSKLHGAAIINGKSVNIFEPPHNEPDFPWIDVHQLAQAFLPDNAALMMLKNAQRYDDGKAVQTISHGGALVTIQCHAMAQGMCGAIDHNTGHGDDGPAFTAYTNGARPIFAANGPQTVDELFHAVKNPGGPYLE